ncbi:MAG: site-specific integrase [Lachnospiraceae bacterium]|nr:site-specific integrase [Lachnospiraceae bacterium]
MASIRKRGNSYQITVSNGRRIDGSQIVETATFTPDPKRTEKQNQKALEKFVFEFEEKVKSGKFLDGEKITFQAFSDTWLSDYALQHLEPTTIDIYKKLLRVHIIPAIGNLKLARIQPSHLNRLYNVMLQERKDGKLGGYSPTTIKRVHALISSILNTAVKWNVVLENPCERVSPPKQTRDADSIQFFTLEQTGVFLAAVDAALAAGRIRTQHKIFFHLALFCGLRRGELVALTWSDFDFNRCTVSITKSTGLVDGKPFTKAPKNKTSVRTVSVPESVMLLVRNYQREQYRLRLSLGSYWKGNNYVFIQADGKQMYPSTPYSVFKDVIHVHNQMASDAEQLPDIPLHGLRHTSATLLISQNVDIRTVSGRLGHAQTSTTMNIYSHQLQSMDEKAAGTLETLLNPVKSKIC